MRRRDHVKCECGHSKLVHGDLLPMCLMPDCGCTCYVQSRPRLLVLDSIKELARAC